MIKFRDEWLYACGMSVIPGQFENPAGTVKEGAVLQIVGHMCREGEEIPELEHTIITVALTNEVRVQMANGLILTPVMAREGWSNPERLWEE